MRYFQEYRHKFSDASGVAIDAGKKLLGYIANQKRLSGVDSMVQRISVQDEEGAVWIVEARFDKDIPSVRIFPPNSDSAACELYVESGLLDLGPNIAGDAGERFNRGLPQFSEDPATLYFGTGVECVEGQPGLNGAVRLQGQNVASDCLPNIGNGIASRLTSAVKKQAQALLPASCWSGLMQRYVQAVYGGDTLDYSATATALTIGGATIPTEASVGIVSNAGQLRFVAFSHDTGIVEVRRMLPASACFAAMLNAWRSMSDTNQDQKRKVLSIALSGCVIGPVETTIDTGVTGNVHFHDRPAMHFSDDGHTGAIVLESGGTATAYRVIFSTGDDGLIVDLSAIDSGAVVNGDDDTWPLYTAGSASAFGQNSAKKSNFSGSETLALGDNFDFPVYAICDSDGINLIRYSLILADEVVPDADACSGGDEWPIAFGDTAPCSSNIHSFVSAVSGYYCAGSSGVLWSSVETTQAIKIGGDIKVNADSARAKALAVVAVGDETISSSTTTGLYPLTTIEWGPGSEIDQEAEGDCLSSSGLFGHVIYETTTTWTGTSADCLISIDTVTGPCIGPSTGTGFPTYLSIKTCDTYFTGGIDGVSASCEIILRSQEATVYPFYFAGTLRAPSPHVLSMCAGSYDFVSERYAINLGVGRYASRESSWIPGESRYSCDFSAAVRRYTADDPGGHCADPPSSVTASDEGDFSGHYESEFEGYDLLSRVQFQDYMSDSYVDGYGKSLQRGTEAYKAIASYGQETDADGSISWDSTNEESVDFEINGYGDVTGACPFISDVAQESVADDPIKTTNAGSADSEVRWYDNPLESMVSGFSYAGARSLLGAKIVHTLQLDRGASINMDRETITGGYSPVSTPSFVGWA